MAERKMTPMLRQYLNIKEQYPDCLVFFRLGDFYEMFFDDAVTGAKELDLALTTRDRNKPPEERTPMCGVPTTPSGATSPSSPPRAIRSLSVNRWRTPPRRKVWWSGT